MSMPNDGSRIVKDPICGKDVDTLRARAVGIFGGVTYYFCSAGCKARFVDPRQPAASSDAAAVPVPDRRRPQADKSRVAAAPELELELEARPTAGDDEPVRYARSRIRRITGEVGTPVVQIDLSPHKRPPASPPSGTASVPDVEPVAPPKSGSRWLLVAIVLLVLAAGGVLLFTLKR